MAGEPSADPRRLFRPLGSRFDAQPRPTQAGVAEEELLAEVGAQRFEQGGRVGVVVIGEALRKRVGKLNLPIVSDSDRGKRPELVRAPTSIRGILVVMPEDAVDEEQEDEDVRPAPPPYVFDASHVADATSLLDAACVDLDHGYTMVARLIELARERGLSDTPLMWELAHAVGHDLQRETNGRPGCSLGRDLDENLLRWPRPIASAPPDALQLWEAAAGSVSAPAAIARLEDLLFERRVGNGLERARRASAGYLAAIDAAGACGMAEVDALLRVWTLARSVKEHALDAEVRARMAHIAAEVMRDTPGAQPGVVLPLLSALTQGPVTPPDPHDVDGLLAHAAAVYRKGYLAAQIAGDRRRRAAGDANLLEQIARDEVESFSAEADDAANGAVRMHHLNAAARVATDRGLPELAREAAARMQRIKPSDLGMQRIRVESSLPKYVPESYIARFTQGGCWRDGLRYFFSSDVPSGHIDHVRTIGSSSRGTLASIFPTTLFGAGGMPRVTAADEEAHGMNRAASMGAQFYGQMFAIGLDHIAERYGAPSLDELTNAIVAEGCRDPQLARALARGFDHFFKGDYESCAAVVIPKFEAAARSLLRELDEGIYRVQVGNDPGGYIGLYSLLDELEKLALDESWAYFFRWLLLGPYGANLRNDVAHGFMFDPGPVYAALLLRAVSVLVLVADTLPTDDYLPQVGTDQIDVRPRQAVVDALSDPIGSDKLGNSLGRIADWLERAVWWLRARVVRRSARRRDRSRA